jgi:hydroxyquinol 1,2-dioxygenase
VEGQTTPQEITEKVLASFEGTENPRTKELMRALVSHIHAFVIETGLTEDEWAQGIAALTATGHITDDKRQEFILWSDSLGVSMLVDALANAVPSGATESTVLGPFYVPNSPLREPGENMAEQEAGVPAYVHGRVLDLDGNPLAGAELDVWQNGDNRLYAVQDPDAPDDHLRGRYRTDDEGRFAFQAVRPVPYTIPYDGPVGAMFTATGRHPWRPAHIHIVVRHPEARTVTTHIFDVESEWLDGDTVFAVKPSLCREFVEHAAGEPGAPEGVDGPWVSLELDLVLAPGRGEVPVDHGRTH